MTPVEAVAIDLGATSLRYAVGALVDGKIEFEIVEQIEHEPVDWCGQTSWDMDAIMRICKRALRLAQEHDATIGIDSWAVDHGFISTSERLLLAPVCYRDLSHQRVFSGFTDRREEIYQATGIQHQPFNTLYQLYARAQEAPELKQGMWLLMPDLIGCLLGGAPHVELTNASTTQLLGTDGKWSEEMFDLIDWPVPDLPVSAPGNLLIDIETSRLVSVGSHDTASAVFGLGPLADDQAFVSVGTWSLLGCLLDEPNLSDPGFTNERAVDGRIRYLANVPGFYVIERVHEELGIDMPIPEWLDAAGEIDPNDGVDLMAERFFNPVSMSEEISATVENGANRALASLVKTSVAQIERLERNTGREIKSLRACGGGSQSPAFCRSLSKAAGRPVIAGPKEATLLGNFAVQFYADERFASLVEANEAAGRSFEPVVY